MTPENISGDSVTGELIFDQTRGAMSRTSASAISGKTNVLRRIGDVTRAIIEEFVLQIEAAATSRAGLSPTN